MIWNAKNGCVKIDDTDMNYVSFGKGSKNLIVMPGLSDGLVTVKGKALLLASSYIKYFEDYTVYMFSRKNAMPEGYSIREMAADQAKALKELGITKTSVMGVSQGGMIAQWLAVDYPDMMDKLILVVTAPKANSMVHANVSAWIEMAKQGDHKSLMIDVAEKAYSEKYLKVYRKAYPILGYLGKPRSYDRFFVNANAILGFDAFEELEKISCPAYIIAGNEDGTVGVDASYELKERIKDSELYVYEGLGHAAYEEGKDFYDRVLDFLKK